MVDLLRAAAADCAMASELPRCRCTSLGVVFCCSVEFLGHVFSSRCANPWLPAQLGEGGRAEMEGEGEGRQGKARKITKEVNKFPPVPTVITRGTDVYVLIRK